MVDGQFWQTIHALLIMLKLHFGYFIFVSFLLLFLIKP